MPLFGFLNYIFPAPLLFLHLILLWSLPTFASSKYDRCLMQADKTEVCISDEVLEIQEFKSGTVELIKTDPEIKIPIVELKLKIGKTVFVPLENLRKRIPCSSGICDGAIVLVDESAGLQYAGKLPALGKIEKVFGDDFYCVENQGTSCRVISHEEASLPLSVKCILPPPTSKIQQVCKGQEITSQAQYKKSDGTLETRERKAKILELFQGIAYFYGLAEYSDSGQIEVVQLFARPKKSDSRK